MVQDGGRQLCRIFPWLVADLVLFGRRFEMLVVLGACICTTSLISSDMTTTRSVS